MNKQQQILDKLVYKRQEIQNSDIPNKEAIIKGLNIAIEIVKKQ